MIYRYVVRSTKDGSVGLHGPHSLPFQCVQGIDPTILVANRQFHHEAEAILYGENQICCTIIHPNFVKLREDEAMNASFHSLRSSRKYTKVGHKGFMYPGVFAKFRTFEFQLSYSRYERDLTPTEQIAANLSADLKRFCLLLVGKQDIKRVTVTRQRHFAEGGAIGAAYLPVILEPLKLLRKVRSVDIEVEECSDELRKSTKDTMMEGVDERGNLKIDETVKDAEGTPSAEDNHFSQIPDTLLNERPDQHGKSAASLFGPY